MNVFRLLSLQILKNITYEMLYDENLNQQTDFQARKSYPNLDRDFEAHKVDALRKFSSTLTLTDPQATSPLLNFIRANSLF